MKTENNYMLGTVKEIAEAIVKNIADENKGLENNAQQLFKNCDFTISYSEYSLCDIHTLAEIYEDSESGIYGIKCIDTGFGNVDIDIFADYYGGGSGHYGVLAYGEGYDECTKDIKKLILQCLNVVETCDENTILVAQWVED